MLKVENLSVQIKNINILDSVSFKVSKFSSIIGRNGAGKTTLIRAIMSILPAQKGNISFNNNFLTDTKPYNMTKMGIGYMPEDRRLIPDLTVEDNILVPLWSLKNYNQKDELERILTFIPEVKLFLSRGAYQLSGGQQKLVALARAMIVGKKLLLLDEPFEGVAPALANRIFGLIKNLRKEKLNVIITESDSTHSSKVAEKIYSIERGEIKTRTNV